jgi:heme-degrading monooxygenase HmoA
MATLYIHHKVENYEHWRKVFDGQTSMRTGFGCTGHQVFQSANDPCEITILTHWRSAEAAKKFAALPELKDDMKNAGVISQPDVMILQTA